MQHSKRGRPTRVRLGVLAIWCVAILGAPMSASGWKDALKASLEESYPLSKRASLSPDRITRQGIVLIIQKAGIAADPSSDLRYSVTEVRNNQVGEQGGAAPALFNKENTRTFKPGERVYVTGIRVGDDNVMFLIMSVDMFDVVQKGSTRQTRYKAAVKFKFEKGDLAAGSPDKVKQAVKQILATEAEASAANTKTIALGQTTEQVQAILGSPERIVNLGQKKIYIYKDMKIVFMDGKVADVQ